LTINQVFEQGIPAVVSEMRALVGGRPVYVSLDIDAVDPAFAPGTGTPEVGGLSSYQMLQLVRGLRGLNIVGFDLVEVSPPYDHGDITSILAANLAFEFLSLLALSKREENGGGAT
jgi:arginase family enzyme